MYSYTKNPARITRLLKIWLSLSIVIAIATVLSNNSQLGQSASSLRGRGAATDSGIGALLYLLDFFVGLTAGITFLRWIYITTTNCRGFGAQGMFCNPGQAVGYYFMPVYGLYKPYYSLKEIWQSSQNPLHWKGMKGSPAIIIWWILWNLSSFYNNIDQNTPATFTSTHAVLVSSMYTKGMHISMCLLAIYLVTRISKMQEALIHQTSTEPQQDGSSG